MRLGLRMLVLVRVRAYAHRRACARLRTHAGKRACAHTTYVCAGSCVHVRALQCMGARAYARARMRMHVGVRVRALACKPVQIRMRLRVRMRGCAHLLVRVPAGACT